MPQFLVAVHHPDTFDPSQEAQTTIENISALNREMIAAGVRNFACGLASATQAKTLRSEPGGGVLITDGPFLEAKEHVGGFWVLETADMDQALAWARKAVIACRAPVEVRAMLFRPTAEQRK